MRFSIHIVIIAVLWVLKLLLIIHLLRGCNLLSEIYGFWGYLIHLSKFRKLFVISGLILRCHLIVRFFEFSIKMRPFWTYMPHDFIGWPFWVLLLEYFSISLTKVNVGWEWFLRSALFLFGCHVRTKRLIIVCRWCFLKSEMRIYFATFQWCSFYHLYSWVIMFKFIMLSSLVQDVLILSSLGMINFKLFGRFFRV